MTPAEETLFAQALELPATDRAAFLMRACAADAALRQSIESLLAAHEKAAGFLQFPLPEMTPSNDRTLSVAPAHDPIGSMIGPYKLLERIGEGGMGAVYMAEQTHPVRRRVALKIIKPGLDTKQTLARFEAERQALAMMDHPNIAKVLDAGATGAGRPYFVMELVRGVAMTDYCDQHRFTSRQRLELFIPVCHAVQHAHQKGIIHRDLKPSNVLVTLGDDGKPLPKIIDFGIAKATSGQPLTERTLFTEFRQLVGTPLYMAPEQVEPAASDVDTRADIYSLGVLLYELLTGTTPFDKKRLACAAFDEIRRILRDEDPPRPSTRLSTLGQTLTSVSSHRQTDAKRLEQSIRGELEWIVMKAMEKDRQRRYETASGLARDVERYLKDEAVEACPPSRIYRFRKFARRNRSVLATVAVIGVILIAASAISTWQAIRATREHAEARREAEKQQAINTFLHDMLQSANPYAASATETYKGKDVTVLQAVNGAVRRLDEGALRDRPDIESAVRAVIGETYSSLGELELAGAQMIQGLGLAQQAYGPEHSEVAQQMINLGWFNLYHGDKSHAESLLRQGVAMQRKTLGNKTPDFVESLHRLCAMLLLKHDTASDAEAEKAAREILTIDPQEVRPLADVLAQERRFSEAEPLYRQALARMQSVKGPDHPSVATTLKNLALMLIQEGRLNEAETALRQAMAMDQKRLPHKMPSTQVMLARVLLREGKLQEAAEQYRLATQGYSINNAGHDPGLITGAWDFYYAHRMTAQADALLRDTIAADTQAIRLRPDMAGLYAERAFCYRKKGDFRKMLDDCSEALRLVPGKAAYRMQRAMAYLLLGDASNADADIGYLAAANDLNELAWVLATDPDFVHCDSARAVAAAQKALATNPANGDYWNTLGVAQYHAGQFGDAIKSLGKSRELHKDQLFSWDGFFLAMAHWRLEHQDEARNWYTQSIAWMDKNAPINEELVRFRAEAAQLMGIPLLATRPTTRPNRSIVY